MRERASELDPDRSDYLGVGADGYTVLLVSEDANGFGPIGGFQVATPIQECFLLDWDDNPASGPEVALLTAWGLQIHEPDDDPLRRVRAYGPSAGIACVRQASGGDQVAWVVDVPVDESSFVQALLPFEQDNPTYEGPTELQSALGGLVDSLQSNDFDCDGDGDLLMSTSASAVVKRVENLTGVDEEEQPIEAFTYLETTPRPELDEYVVPFDVARDVDAADAVPVAWCPLYGEAQENGTPILDFAALASEDGEPFVRLLSGGDPPIRCCFIRPPEFVHPFDRILTRSNAHTIANPEGNPGDTNGVLDVQIELTDIWLNDPLANAFEVVVWRHSFAWTEGGILPAPYPDQVAVAHYIFVIPPHANDQYVLPYVPTLETVEWFPHAYFLTLRRIHYDVATSTIVRGWRTYTAGLAMGDCILTTLNWIHDRPDAGQGTIHLSTHFQEAECGEEDDPLGIVEELFANPPSGAGSVPQVRLPPPNLYPPPVVHPADVLILPN